MEVRCPLQRKVTPFCVCVCVCVYVCVSGSIEDRKYLRRDILDKQVDFNVIVCT